MGSKMSCVKGDKNNQMDTTETVPVYHEKQSRELCALHALNNLLQERKFTKKELDDICTRLAPASYINPHRSFLGLGNYDVNVIMAALQTKDLYTVWFDKRKDLNKLVLENIQGFILNVPTDLKFGFVHLPIHRKHWVVVRQIANKYYDLDSKLDAPELIGGAGDVRTHLQEQMSNKDKEMLLVVTHDVCQTGTWYKIDGEESNNGNVPSRAQATTASVDTDHSIVGAQPLDSAEQTENANVSPSAVTNGNIPVL